MTASRGDIKPYSRAGPMCPISAMYQPTAECLQDPCSGGGGAMSYFGYLTHGVEKPRWTTDDGLFIYFLPRPRLNRLLPGRALEVRPGESQFECVSLCFSAAIRLLSAGLPCGRIAFPALNPLDHEAPESGALAKTLDRTCLMVHASNMFWWDYSIGAFVPRSICITAGIVGEAAWLTTDLRALSRNIRGITNSSPSSRTPLPMFSKTWKRPRRSP